MPIEVRHDVSGGALARLAALSGLRKQGNIEADRRQIDAAREQQAFLTIQGREQQDRQQANQLAAAKDRQQEQIRAAAERQSQAADQAAARTALAAGLEKQVKEDAFDRELETIQAQAKARAEQWEYQYSAKARQDIARGNSSLQQIDQMESSGQIDSVTAERMRQPVRNFMTGISSSRVPVGPDHVPKERQSGFTDFDEHGNLFTIGADGRRTILQTHDETPEGVQKAHERAMEIKQLDIQAKEQVARQKRVEDIRKFRFEKSQEKVEETKEPLGGLEIDRQTMERFGGEAIQEFRDQGRRPASELPSIEEMEADLQKRVDTIKQAKAFLKEMEKRYPDVKSIPPEVQREILQADEIVKRVKSLRSR